MEQVKKDFPKSGEKWNNDEVEELIKDYQENNMNINELGKKYQRTPGGICYKLKQKKIIKNNSEALGYKEYKNSSTYKNIVANDVYNNKEKSETITIKKSEYLQLKKDAEEMKECIKKLTTMLSMTQTYEKGLK